MFYCIYKNGCCEFRGVSASNSLTQTAALSGVFKSDVKVRQEFYDNIKLQKVKN